MRRCATPIGTIGCDRPGLPCVCRPAGWIAIWRRIGQISVLDQRPDLSS